MTKTIPYKEVNKKLKSGLKQIKEAIDILKTHIVIAEIVIPSVTKAVKPRKARTTPAPKEKELPDADAKGYMKERKEETD